MSGKKKDTMEDLIARMETLKAIANKKSTIIQKPGKILAPSKEFYKQLSIYMMHHIGEFSDIQTGFADLGGYPEDKKKSYEKLENLFCIASPGNCKTVQAMIDEKNLEAAEEEKERSKIESEEEELQKQVDKERSERKSKEKELQDRIAKQLEDEKNRKKELARKSFDNFEADFLKLPDDYTTVNFNIKMTALKERFDKIVKNYEKLGLIAPFKIPRYTNIFNVYESHWKKIQDAQESYASFVHDFDGQNSAGIIPLSNLNALKSTFDELKKNYESLALETSHVKKEFKFYSDFFDENISKAEENIKEFGSIEEKVLNNIALSEAEISKFKEIQNDLLKDPLYTKRIKTVISLRLLYGAKTLYKLSPLPFEIGGGRKKSKRNKKTLRRKKKKTLRKRR